MSRGEKRTTRRGRPLRRGAGGVGFWGVAALAVGVALLRFVAASHLQEQSLLAHPVLEDASYLAAAQLDPAASGVEPPLPRGSVLYTTLLRGLPGISGGDFTAVAALQATAEGLTVLIVGLWVASHWGLLAAVLGGALYALDPLGSFHAARLAPFALALPLFAAALLLLPGGGEADRGVRGPGRVGGPLSTLAFGLLVAGGFLLTPFLFFALAVLGTYRGAQHGAAAGEDGPLPKGGPHGKVVRLGTSSLAFLPLLVVALWMGADHSRLRDGGPALSWGAGISVFHATNLETGGTPRYLEIPQWRTEGAYRTDTWEGLAKEGTSYDVFRFHLVRGLQRLVERPVEFVGVELVKLAATTGAAPLPDTGPSPAFVLGHGGFWGAGGAWSFALLLGLGLAGWLAVPADAVRRRLGLGLLLVLAVCLLGTTSAAARQPAVLLLAFAGGGFLASLVGRVEGNRARTLLPLLALGLGIGLSIAIGRLSPTAALLDPSEELRLAGTTAMARSPREAAPLLEQAVSVNPRNVEARVSLARAYQRDGLVDGMHREYAAAFAIDSTNASVLLGVAAIAQEAGDANRAIELISRLVGAHPNNPLYLNEGGRMLLQAGRWDLAKGFFVRALEIKPDYRTAQTNLETVARMELEAERSLVPDEMRLPSDDPLNTTLTQIGIAMQQGRLAAADSLIAIAEAARPDHVLPHWMRGALAARAGDLPAATRALETCARLAPCRPGVVAQLGQLYVQTGRTEEARRLLDGCVANPPSEELRARLEETRRLVLGN